MIDYDLKSRVLDLGLDELQRQISKSLFYHDYPNPEVICEICYPLAFELYLFYKTCHAVLWHEAEKINHARYERVRRLKFYVNKLLSYGNAKFLTFTFDKKSINNLSQKTRKTYVTRFLCSLGGLYVANLDFGNDFFYVDDTGEDRQGTQREHFHAIVNNGSSKINYKSWKYGNLDGRKVRSLNDSPALSQYVSKMTNHAIKETTKRSSMIYSRMTFQEFERLQQKNNFKFNIVESDEQCVFESEFVQDCLFD